MVSSGTWGSHFICAAALEAAIAEFKIRPADQKRLLVLRK
jgi:hypothetical protein